MSISLHPHLRARTDFWSSGTLDTIDHLAQAFWLIINPSNHVRLSEHAVAPRFSPLSLSLFVPSLFSPLSPCVSLSSHSLSCLSRFLCLSQSARHEKRDTYDIWIVLRDGQSKLCMLIWNVWFVWNKKWHNSAKKKDTTLIFCWMLFIMIPIKWHQNLNFQNCH